MPLKVKPKKRRSQIGPSYYSAYSDSDMTPREMLAVMSAERSETEDGEEEDDVPSSETESPEQESEDGGEGETGEGSGEAGAETEDGEAGTE